MSPQEFLELLSEEGGDDTRFSKLVIVGDLDLAEWEESRPGVKKIPPCLIQGNIKAAGCQSLEKLDCKVEGFVDLQESTVVEIGESFAVSGDFLASECSSLKSLRGSFGADVIFRASSIEEIPAGVKIAGDLSISRCKHLRKVDCEVGGSLHSIRSSVETLGINFRCGGDVNIIDCANLKTIGYIGLPQNVYLTSSGVEVVTENFECRESLYINDNESLLSIGSGSGINVGKTLLVSGCPRLTSLTANGARGDTQVVRCSKLKELKGHFSGGLLLSNCGVEHLSKHLWVAGHFIVDKCSKLVSLSSRTGKNLELGELKNLSSISEEMRCGRDMVVQGCPALRTISGEIKGDLLLFGTADIPVLDHSLRVFGGFRAAGGARNNRRSGHGKLIKIGRIETQFGGEVTLHQVDLGSTGAGFACDSFHMTLSYSNPDLRGKVKSDAVITHSPIEVIGAAFECGGDMKLENCMALSRLNCNISGNLSLFESQSPAFLPAFHCSGSVFVVKCVNSKGEPSPALIFPPPPPTKDITPTPPQKGTQLQPLEKPNQTPQNTIPLRLKRGISSIRNIQTSGSELTPGA